MVRWSAAKEGWGVQLLVAGCLLLAATAGCGSPVSDKSANAELRTENGKPEDRTGAVQPGLGKLGQDDPATAIGFRPAILQSTASVVSLRRVSQPISRVKPTSGVLNA